MHDFELNRRGKIVFPGNFFPELDFSVLESLEQLDSAIGQNFDATAPTATEIQKRIRNGVYRTRFELMRDMALNLFWANRYTLTMYDSQPTRWADVPHHEDVFVAFRTAPQAGDDDSGTSPVAPVMYTPRGYRFAGNANAVFSAYWRLPAQFDENIENNIFEVLFDTFAHRRNDGEDLSALIPAVPEFLAEPSNQTLRMVGYDPAYLHYSYSEIIDCHENVAELEALRRWSMVLHNQYPWQQIDTNLATASELQPDDHVLVFRPRDPKVAQFVFRMNSGQSSPRIRRAASRSQLTAKIDANPASEHSAIAKGNDFEVHPRIAALAAVRGELECTNDDLIRNSATNWPPLSADDISARTGVEKRHYTLSSVEDLAIDAASAALAHSGLAGDHVSAVIVCTSTSERHHNQSVAAAICGELGIHQASKAFDLAGGAAGFVYGLSAACNVLQETQRPVLLICAEKFSDKVGNLAASRMTYSDGAAAMIVTQTPEGSAPDIEYLKTYAGLAADSEQHQQMFAELAELPDPSDDSTSLLPSIDLVVPHQAHRSEVTKAAVEAGIPENQVYLNVARVGDTSAASIPLAIHDAVRGGEIAGTARVFTPAFDSSGVAGYSILRIDEAIVAPD